MNISSSQSPADGPGRTPLDGAFTPAADGWVQLLQPGEWPHAKNEVVQVVDATAINAIVDAFNRDARQPNFPGLLVDFDHFSYDDAKPTEAAGWISELQARPGSGLWGRVRWSDKGLEALKMGRYRMLSPAVATVPVGSDKSRVRIVRLDSVALTNCPNMKGLQLLSNRLPDYVPGPSVRNRLSLADAPTNEAGHVVPGAEPALPFAANTAEGAAARRFWGNTLRAVQKVQSESGWTFNAAWSYLQRTSPQLFERVPS